MPIDIERKRKRQREWKAARRAKWFADKSCLVCGTTENLQLDHINPEDKIDHRIWSWKWERISAEVDKCQVLCETHHIEKSRKNGDFNYRLDVSKTPVLQ
jgi:5-methylcytosine-specific restriction endonuclease McrA